MVATPYTKLMTAVMDVDMAAAVLVATEARADQLGVPRDRRVYLRGAGAAEEPATMASRPELWRSPAMASAASRALGTSGSTTSPTSTCTRASPPRSSSPATPWGSPTTGP